MIENPLIVVAGATGAQGGAVIDALLKKSIKVRAIVRNKESEAHLSQGKLITPFAPETKLDWVAGTDVGRFAAEAFAQPEKFHEKEITMVGDQLTMPEVAELLTSVTGQQFEAISVSFEEAVKLGLHAGVARSYVWMNVEGYKVNSQDASIYEIELETLKSFIEANSKSF